MQCIIVKCLAPTHTRARRVVASTTYSKTRLCRTVRPGEDFPNAADVVVGALCKRLDWHGRLHRGRLDADRYVYVFETNEGPLQV